MLIGYGVKNFGPLREWNQVSFKLTDTAVNRQKLANHNNISNLLCVKGANASGKTNLLKVLSFLSYFNSDSFTKSELEEEMPVQSFFNNSDPIEFYVDFMLSGVEYSFELSLTAKKVVEEKLYRKKTKNILLYHRKGLSLEAVIGEFSGLKKVTLRDNSSLICSARLFGEKSLDEINTFFKDMVTNVTSVGFAEDRFSIEMISELYQNNEGLFSFCKEVMRENDLGLNDISLEKRITKDDKVVYIPTFSFKVAGETKWLSYTYQSNGTKQLYRKLVFYALALKNGSVAIIDEFDSHLHPHILPHIIKKFEDKDVNHKNAQLIFTCHDSTIMNIMGQYRTALVQKKGNECFSYRLDELEGSVIRNDRPVAPLYDKGYLGGYHTMARQKKNNKVKNSFLATLPIKTLEGCLGELNLKCKFNFSYIDFNQSVAFIDLPGKQQDELFEKLKDFSNKSLEQRSHERAGKSGLNRFENYGADYDFTIKSAFTRPKIVPTDVEWCRFRLAGKFRVDGFILPPKHIEAHCNLDRNTFYVVFIDPEHKFYKTG